MASGSGRIEIDFGPYPGQSDASVTVTGATVASISATSDVEAYITAVPTTDHSADEHLVDPPRVIARRDTIVAGTSFRIDGIARGQVAEPVTPEGPNGHGPADAQGFDRGGKMPRTCGKWTVGYAWSD